MSASYDPDLNRRIIEISGAISRVFCALTNNASGDQDDPLFHDFLFGTTYSATETFPDNHSDISPIKRPIE